MCCCAPAGRLYGSRSQRGVQRVIRLSRAARAAMAHTPAARQYRFRVVPVAASREPSRATAVAVDDRREGRGAAKGARDERAGGETSGSACCEEQDRVADGPLAGGSEGRVTRAPRIVIVVEPPPVEVHGSRAPSARITAASFSKPRPAEYPGARPARPAPEWRAPPRPAATRPPSRPRAARPRRPRRRACGCAG